MAEVAATNEELGGSSRPALEEDVQAVLKGLDTGDLVLFDRPCLKMGGVFGTAICMAAKVVGGSPFDHVGVVVREESSENVLVEASFSGVAARPLGERIRRSSANQICVRRLQTHRTEEMRAEARRFVSDVAHLPYKEGGEGLLQMASAAFRFHPAKERRRRVHAETVALSASIARLERELVGRVETKAAPVLKDRLRRAITHRRKALVFLDRAATSKPPAKQAVPIMVTTSQPPAIASATLPPQSQHDGGLFCSELVAALYQRLGLLDAPFPKVHDYVPADFARALGDPTDCIGGERGDGNTTTSSWQTAADSEPTAAVGEGETISDKASSTSLPLSIPGDGRVALLNGAVLCPGVFLRGGPRPRTPSSPPRSPADGTQRGTSAGRSSPPASVATAAAATGVVSRSKRVQAGRVQKLGEGLLAAFCRSAVGGREGEPGRGLWLPESTELRPPRLWPQARVAALASPFGFASCVLPGPLASLLLARPSLPPSTDASKAAAAAVLAASRGRLRWEPRRTSRKERDGRSPAIFQGEGLGEDNTNSARAVLKDAATMSRFQSDVSAWSPVFVAAVIGAASASLVEKTLTVSGRRGRTVVMLSTGFTAVVAGGVAGFAPGATTGYIDRRLQIRE